MSSNSGGSAKEKDPENAPELVALPLVRTLRPVHAVIDPAADPRSAQLSWPGHVVLLPPYATWPHHVPTPPPAVNPANPQQNGVLRFYSCLCDFLDLGVEGNVHISPPSY